MAFQTEAEAVTYIFRSLRKLRGVKRGDDELFRDVTPTHTLIQKMDLLAKPREYAVVTGSKGKGSATVITAKLLQHLGHTVGMMTSPHLVSWRERIRVNGRAIPEADFLRILSELSPAIDVIEAGLEGLRHFSPQGIFLAIALRWFDECGVNAAVLEVGRGGRFDDIAVVPNKLSIFTPILLEHTQYLGDTLERIAWHKAGIIKDGSSAYSSAQAPEVLAVLQAEADARNAEFSWIAAMDEARYLGPAADGKGIRMQMGRYGEVMVSMLGHYSIANATLAVTAVGNMHSRLPGIPHGSPEYTAAIRAGLADITWPGRAQKLQENPTVFLDGAVHGYSAQTLVESLRPYLTDPIISVICVPDDKDYVGVYRALGAASQSVILTDTERNPILHFLEPDAALQAAQPFNEQVTYISTVKAAVEKALEHAGKEGTVLLVGTQSLLADAMEIWGLHYEVI